MKPDQRGGDPLLTSSMEPLRKRGALLAPPAPLHKVGAPQSQRKGVTCVDTAGAVGMGQRKCPQRQCPCPNRGNREIP